MSHGEFELHEHDDTTSVRAKKVVLYGWDPDALVYRKVAVNSDGQLVTGASVIYQSMSFYVNGDAVVDNLVIDGIYFQADIKITKIAIFADVSPTGANLIIDQTVGGAVQSKAATLTAGSQYEETDTADLSVLTTDRYGLKITQVGSTLPGAGLKITIFFQKV